MKKLTGCLSDYKFSGIGHQCLLFLILIFLSACNVKKQPFSILEFRNADEVSNYSKTLLMSVSKPARDSNTFLLGNDGDLFVLGDFLYQFRDTSVGTGFLVQYTDSLLFINGKIACINISGKDSSIPWMKNIMKNDLSALQMINISSDTIGGCVGDLTALAKLKPGAGIVFSGDFVRMGEITRLFHPQVIISPTLYKSDYGQLAELTGLQMLFAEAGDSLLTDPLPAMPSLKHLALTDINEHAVITGDLLINNKQLERIGLGKEGILDLSLLHHLKNLKELVIIGADSILNPEEINLHKNLELLSLSGDKLDFDPSVFHLPRLRWIAIPSCVTQDEFTTLMNNHPNLEVVEISGNDTITSLKPLSALSKLSGLTVLDTLTDLATVKTMKNLKYLSLPGELLDDSLLTAELHRALPGTKIAANDGFCLGSGWLLLLLPAVFGVRMILNLKRRRNCLS